MSEYKLPYYVDFSVTPYCNLKCGFCSTSAKGNRTKIKELSLEDIDKIFQEFDKNEILRVSIEGGEHFLRDDIIDILKMADEHNFTYYINTNGTLITKDLAKEIKKTKVEKLCVSVDGPNDKIHDASRGITGAFDKMLDGINFLMNEDVLVGLTILSKENKLPVNFSIVPTGESKLPWEIYLPFKGSNMEDDYKLWVNDKNISTLDSNDFGCTAGKDNLAIDGFGNVYGCSLMISEEKLRAGNILKQPLKDIWNDSLIFQNLRANNLSLVEGECKNCDLLHKCQAGCRSCAFSLEKSIIASDIRCPLAKKRVY